MKLGEAVEWLERNYDQYTVEEFTSIVYGFNITFWVAPPGLRFEMGRGPSHNQPMLCLKDDTDDSHLWRHDDMVPLQREVADVSVR